LEFNLEPGITGEHRLVVTKDKCANRDYIREDIWVFSTPDMIRSMEFACIKAVLPHLPDGWRTVGTVVDVKHLKATLLGKEVVACGELVKMEGRKLWFNVEAHDEEGLIGKGEHGRYIINVDDFASILKE